MKAMSALALAAVGLAGVVAAQTTGQYPAEKMQNPPMTPPNVRSCK